MKFSATKIWLPLLLVCAATSVHAQDFSPARPMPSALLDDIRTITRLVLGSCYQPRYPDRIFRQIREEQADAFLFIGDNVYADSEAPDPTLSSLREAYARLADSLAFAGLRETTPVLATWDDHDYGLDDAGGDWPDKFTAEALFEYVWAIPDNDVRRQRDGVYFSRTAGPAGRRVQVILLDTRFFRTPYDSETPDMLGHAQWQWLAEQLSQPAELRVLVSSMQLLGTGYSESWSRMPSEQYRLLELLRDSNAAGVIVVSGDLHSGAFYRARTLANEFGRVDLNYPLIEMTASSLNDPLTGIVANIVDEPMQYRVGLPYHDANFGRIDVNWQEQSLTLSLVGETGRVERQMHVPFDTLNIRPR